MGRPSRNHQTVSDVAGEAFHEEQDAQLVPNAVEEKAPTIKNIDQFIEAWEVESRTGQKRFNEALLVALRSKLSGLVKTKQAHPKELQLLMDILKRDRRQGVLNYVYASILAEHEASQCEQWCEVKSDSVPPILRWRMGDKMKYRYDTFDQRYHVYQQEIVPSDHQYSMDLALRLVHGRHVPDEMYPESYTRWRHKAINEREFNAWFAPVDGQLLDRPIAPVYQAPAKSHQALTIEL